jgi:hypothetical protein
MGVSMVRKAGLGYPLKWFGHILKALTNVSNYFLWNKGVMTNEQLERLFNTSHFAISHSVRIFRAKMVTDKKGKNQFDKINAQFNL